MENIYFDKVIVQLYVYINDIYNYSNLIISKTGSTLKALIAW